MSPTDVTSRTTHKVEGQESGGASQRTDPHARTPNHQQPSAPTARSDRSIGKLLLVFFLALYLFTGSGHGYSPDGDFAFLMARSLTVDPRHEYLSTMRSGFSQWGFIVPLLSQPLVLLGEALGEKMPQKDYATVDGRTFVLGLYRAKGLPEEAPTVGPRGPGVDDSYVLPNPEARPATSLAVISFLAQATRIPKGATVAEITLVDSDGDRVVFPLRAGFETAEWSLSSGGETLHGMARVASIWAGNTSGRNYYAELPFERTLAPREVRIRHLLPEGLLYVRALALLNGETGDFQLVPGENRMWSERENKDLFTRLFYSPYNAIATALGCVLLFALVRLLGYGQRVSVVATLLYGLSTVAWPYAKYDFSEPTLVLLVLATLYLILRWGQGSSDRLLLLAGTTALLSAGTKYVAAVLVPVMLLQILLLHWKRHPSPGDLPRAWRPVLLFCAPFLGIAAPVVWFLSQRFGYYPSIFEAWAGVQRGWLPLPLLIGLSGLLFSPGKSFFLYSPPMILAALSTVPFVRRHGLQSFAFLAITVIYFGIYSKKVAWHAGAGWGPRYQLVIIPLLIVVIAPLILKAIEERHRWSRYALLAAFLLGVGVQLLAVPKNFDQYLGLFRYDIVKQLPDKGAQYGGAEYYPYAEGLDDANSITATVWAWPFSPILAHLWLLSADFLAMGPSFLVPAKEKLLGTPPWKLWGIDVLPAHPEYGLGFDFWSMRLRTDFPSYSAFLAGVFAILLLLEIVLVVSGARLVPLLLREPRLRARGVRGWIGFSIPVLLLFNGIHFLL